MVTYNFANDKNKILPEGFSRNRDDFQTDV